MNTVIKATDAEAAGQVRSIVCALPVEVPSDPARLEMERLHRRIADLERELVAMNERLGEVQADVPRSYAKGEAAGYQRGLSEADAREAERLALLEAGIQAARQDLALALVSLDRLAALLARECLAKILGDPTSRATLVSEILCHQLAQIESVMMAGIEVSRLDFPDETALGDLATRTARPVAQVSAIDLPSGGCVLRLRLGSISVGLDQQWDAIRDLLGELAEPGSDA